MKKQHIGRLVKVLQPNGEEDLGGAYE